MGLDISDTAWLLMVAVLLLSGLVKGVVGLGMPSVLVGLGSMVIGVKPAMALLIVPSFVTNAWQAFDGDGFGRIVKRTWPMMIMIGIGTWLGVLGLSRLDPKILSAVLGATLVGYAIMGLTRARAREAGSRGVRVNAVAPGYIATRLTDVLADAHRDHLLEATAMGRLGTAEDVAGPVAFLCSGASAFITGTVLAVDGGLRI